MNNAKISTPARIASFIVKRRKWLGFLGVSVVAGGLYMLKQGKKQPNRAVSPEHGKEIEKGGQSFRTYMLSGIRFVAPISHPTEPGAGGGIAGIYLHLLWPDIPPGKAPGTTLRESSDKVGNKRSNRVEVQVWERADEHVDIDQYEGLERQGAWTSPDYVSRDDLRLGLRLFTRKNAPKELTEVGFFDLAHSLDGEVLTPYFRLPVVLRGEYVNFIYAPNVHVRIIMHGWGKINPDWKGIYLGVVETLNSYREDNK